MAERPTERRNIEGTGFRSLRAILGALLLFVGIVSVIYASAFHKIPVLVERKSGTTPPPPGAEAIWEPQDQPEPRVVQDVTIGGVERLATGEIRKTYSNQDEIPEACPT